MKFEFTSLQSEPLLYFLLHSGTFVAGLGLVFFLLGLWFGALTWGRYRRQSRRLLEEGNTLREEIAGLKRKLAEQAVRPLSGPLPGPPPKLLTEVLPTRPEIPPERTIAASPPVSKPVEETPPIPLLPDFPEVPQPSPNKVLFKEAAPPPAKGRHSLFTAPLSPLPSRPAVLEEETVEPFSFLMPDEAEESRANQATKEPESKPRADEDSEQDGLDLLGLDSDFSFLLDPEEPVTPAPESAPPSVIPENDPALGLIYKKPPPKADDLTRLNGISPALQNRLHEMGVYRFNQISAWNESHVREFSRRLAFKDRIERERWVEQARRLTAGELV